METAEDRASLEATRWLVALHEDPDDREVRRRFDEWHGASPLNAAAWDETQQLSSLAATMPPAYTDVWTPVIAARQPSAQAGVGSRTGWFLAGLPRWRTALVASAMVVCLAVFVAPAIKLRLQADYTTATAQSRNVVLQDGSEVTLAPDSAMAVSYRAGERQVRLLSGEAFFKVQPEPSRPFRVVTRSVETVVVGTRFDVSMDTDGVNVSVEQGIVRVGADKTASAERSELQAGQAVRVTWNGDITRMNKSSDMVAAWRDGQLVAQNVSLREAIDQLRRYYDGTIILAASSLGERRITGAYNLKDPEDALRGIAHAHGAKVRRITPWILIVSDS